MTKNSSSDKPRKSELRDFIYSTGEALQVWQSIEQKLFAIFHLSIQAPNMMLSGAALHGARHFETKLRIVDATLQVALRDNPARCDLLKKWSKIHAKLRKKAKTRNSIAHGKLTSFGGGKSNTTTLALGPGHFAAISDPSFKFPSDLITHKQLLEKIASFRKIAKEVDGYENTLRQHLP